MRHVIYSFDDHMPVAVLDTKGEAPRDYRQGDPVQIVDVDGDLNTRRLNLEVRLFENGTGDYRPRFYTKDVELARLIWTAQRNREGG